MNIDVPAGVGNMPLDTQLQYRANLEAKSPKLFIRLKVLSKQIFNVKNLEKPGYSTIENNLECCDSNFWMSHSHSMQATPSVLFLDQAHHGGD